MLGAILLIMKKKLVKVGFVFFVVTVISTVAHAVVIPQATKCLLIDFYDFEKDGNLYYRRNVDSNKILEINNLIEKAKDRNRSFWGYNKAEPIFIYCDTDDDYKKFGSPLMTPAVAHMTFESFVVISNDGIDLDILSHEISHTELSSRIGIINRSLKIPVWFDEGIAMQIDHRDYYSIDTLATKSDNFKVLPDVEKMDANQFWSGSRSEVMLNYMTAKYRISQWYSREKIDELVRQINDGKSFQEAYR